MSHPIILSGSVTLFIGLLPIDSSPIKVDSKSFPASIPIINLIVVPEFPTSSISVGGFNPLIPFPFIKTSLPAISISTPIFLKQETVLRQSCPIKKLLTLLFPFDIAENIIDLCDMDLSPINSKVPLSIFALLYYF